jgi:hypothetical protein
VSDEREVYRQMIKPMVSADVWEAWRSTLLTHGLALDAARMDAAAAKRERKRAKRKPNV